MRGFAVVPQTGLARQGGPQKDFELARWSMEAGTDRTRRADRRGRRGRDQKGWSEVKRNPPYTVTRSVVLIATPTARARGQWTHAIKDTCTVLAVADRGSLDRSVVDLKPDVLLLDLALRQLGGIKGVRAIRQMSPQTKIVVLARSPNAKEGISILKAGTRGYCENNIEPLLLKKAVVMVQKGEVWVKRDLIPHLIGELATLTRRRLKDSASHDTRLTRLSPREREVSFLVGEGASNKEIAGRLAVTEHTVKAHLTSIFWKLELSSRVQLALLANPYGRGPTSPTGSDDRSAGETHRATRPKSN